jgi:hypothetical protein
MPGPGPVVASAPSSNIVLVQNQVCTSGTTNAPYACTITSTGSGHLIVILENDADNPAAPSLPTDGGDTFTQDFTSAQVNGEGRSTIFHLCNSISGKTSITINQTSGHSSANIREYSGTATASCLDVVNSSLSGNSSTSIMNSNELAATQNDVAISWCSTGVTATAHMAVADVWTDGIDYPQVNDAGDSFSADILNAFPSNITGLFQGDSHNYGCGIALFKSAVAGSPSGIRPNLYVDFGGITNGTTLTPANMTLNGSHDVNGVWTGSTSPLTGMTASTSCATNPVTPVYSNGTKYTTAANGLAYDLSQANKNLGYGTGTVTSAAAGGFITFPNPSDAVNPYTVLGFTAGGLDRAELFVQNAAWGLETAGGDSSTQSFTYGTLYWWTMQYNAGGTHKLRLYTCSSGCTVQANWTQAGSEATHAATGSNNTGGFTFGRLGAESGNPSITICQSVSRIDWTGTQYPMLP